MGTITLGKCLAMLFPSAPTGASFLCNFMLFHSTPQPEHSVASLPWKQRPQNPRQVKKEEESRQIFQRLIFGNSCWVLKDNMVNMTWAPVKGKLDGFVFVFWKEGRNGEWHSWMLGQTSGESSVKTYLINRKLQWKQTMRRILRRRKR